MNEGSTTMNAKDAITYFSQFTEEKLIREMNEFGIVKNYPSDEVVMNTGDYIKHVPLLISGAIKVNREDQDGELLLYYLEKGDTCAMTLNCCLSGAVSQIKAVTEKPTTLLLFPIAKLDEWMEHKSWRMFVLESYNARMYELLDAVDTLAFKNMSERVEKYLSNQSALAKSKTIVASHEEISVDLNTSRVVVSRILKKLENEGKIELHRGKITLCNNCN